MVAPAQAELVNKPSQEIAQEKLRNTLQGRVEVSNAPVNVVTIPEEEERKIGQTVTDNLKDAGFTNTQNQHVLAGAEATEVLRDIKKSDSGIEVVADALGSAASDVRQTIDEHTQGTEHKYVADPKEGRGNIISFRKAFQMAREKGPIILTNLLHKKAA